MEQEKTSYKDYKNKQSEAEKMRLRQQYLEELGEYSSTDSEGNKAVRTTSRLEALKRNKD